MNPNAHEYYNQVRNCGGNPYQLPSMCPRTGSLMEIVSPSPTYPASRPSHSAGPRVSVYTKIRSLTVLVMASSASRDGLCH